MPARNWTCTARSACLCALKAGSRSLWAINTLVEACPCHCHLICPPPSLRPLNLNLKQLRKARSRLYRGRFLQVSAEFVGLLDRPATKSWRKEKRKPSRKMKANSIIGPPPSLAYYTVAGIPSHFLVGYLWLAFLGSAEFEFGFTTFAQLQT